MSGRRAILIVLDGFGVGAMPDAEPEDAASHTLARIAAQTGPLELPNLVRMGLGNVAGQVLPSTDAPSAAIGRSATGYPGADTYMGHQELMGGELSNVQRRLLRDLESDVVGTLEAAGHDVAPLGSSGSALVVDGCVLVADNVEARPGLNINVTASLDDIDFDALTAIGQLVRGAVAVPRVIVVAGRGFDLDDIRAHMVERTPGQHGVDTPALGVYDEHYQVRHLGAEIDHTNQLPTRACAAGLEAVLLGKAADVVRCEDAVSQNIVATDEVFAAALEHLEAMRSGVIVANVQETDLAGHEQDSVRFRQVLEVVDRHLPLVLDRLREDDVLFISADHGNDPGIGHSQHTREFVPVIAAGPRVTPAALGTRSSLSDVGATMADLLGVGPVAAGLSFLEEIR